MAKTYNANLVRAIVKINSTLNGLGEKVENATGDLIKAVVVTGKVKTIQQYEALREQVFLVEHEKFYGALTKDDLKLAEAGTLKRDGYTKSGKPNAFTAVFKPTVTNAWNLIARAINAGVPLMKNGKEPFSYHEINAKIKETAEAPKLDAKTAQAMVDSALNQMTKVANDIGKYKSAKEGLKNGLLGLLEKVYGIEIEFV